MRLRLQDGGFDARQKFLRRFVAGESEPNRQEIHETTDQSFQLATGASRDNGAERTVSKLTDTQVRGSYTFGRDLAVATVLVNLPTGPSRAPAEDFSVLGAVSSSFLLFPVNSYGNGFSVTSGLAVAVPAGDWNLGLAGSVRVNSEYTPYVDANGPFTYNPGLEGRLRAGLDRLVGTSRLTLGLTYSTFGTDEFASGATVNGVYRPGKRWIAEGAIVAPIQSGTITLAAWNYHRASGDSTGTPVGNRENLFSVGGAGTFRLAQSVDLVLAGDGRFLSPEQGSGTMGGGSIGLSIAAGRGVNFRPSVRYDLGTIKSGSGTSYSVRGVYLAAFLRGSF